MKEIKPLKFEELTVEQKLGLATVSYTWDGDETPDDVDFLEELIKNRSLGGIWVAPREGQNDATIKRLKDAADYPLLVFTDAEGGFGEHTIGKHNALGITDSEELAYVFGKITAAAAAKSGYNVICNPVLDMPIGNSVCGATLRSIGSDKYRVTAIAAAEARGLHDGGCLTIGKHYPGISETSNKIDSHMAETASSETAEELLEHNLYPYVELDKMGLLDGVMLGHSRFSNIDPDYPFSLSKHGIKILRDTGFKGLALTDALVMMGIVAKFGFKRGIGLAIGNAGAMALPFTKNNREMMQHIRECYAEGIITDEGLDEAVKGVLLMQEKLMSLPQGVEITEEDKVNLQKINTDSVFACTDDGLDTALDRNGNYHFTILTEAGRSDAVYVDTFSGWECYNPKRIGERLQELFPNATTGILSEYPAAHEIYQYLNQTLGKEVVFITFSNSRPYVGEEKFAPRIISLMEAMQVSDRISTIVHFGNPYYLEHLPHFPRVIVGPMAPKGIEATLDVLAGDYPAKGVLTYEVPLK